MAVFNQQQVFGYREVAVGCLQEVVAFSNLKNVPMCDVSIPDNQIAQVNDWLARRGLSNVFSCDSEDGSSSSVGGGDGVLMFGLPSQQFHQCPEYSKIVFWFPHGTPIGESTLLASSRIGNQPDQKPQFFDALRTHICRFDSEHQFLTTHAGIASHPFVDRAAQLFDLPIVEFREFPESVSKDWCVNRLAESKRGNQLVAYYDLNSHEQSETTRSFQIDEFLISVAHEVRILSVRKSGNVHSAIAKRLKDTNHKKTFILAERLVVPKLVLDELTNFGAIPWFVYGDHANESVGPSEKPGNIFSLARYSDSESLDDFLLHWTRRRKGPWPTQTANQFLDDLIMGERSANHDRIAALTRILATRKLLANNLLTRDNTPVVCFSDLTVEKLPSLRTFRSHLSRWDFECVGVAIRRNVLESIGSRQVIYGDDETWSKLPAQDRPLFQKRAGESTDWSIEREWRVIGDVDLSKIAIKDAFVFVSTDDEAKQVSAFTNWPIVILDS